MNCVRRILVQRLLTILVRHDYRVTSHVCEGFSVPCYLNTQRTLFSNSTTIQHDRHCNENGLKHLGICWNWRAKNSQRSRNGAKTMSAYSLAKSFFRR